MVVVPVNVVAGVALIYVTLVLMYWGYGVCFIVGWGERWKLLLNTALYVASIFVATGLLVLGVSLIVGVW
jgi:low affinity Fe/Cu permease